MSSNCDGDALANRIDQKRRLTTLSRLLTKVGGRLRRALGKIAPKPDKILGV
jgi:hypothetical protein